MEMYFGKQPPVNETSAEAAARSLPQRTERNKNLPIFCFSLVSLNSLSLSHQQKTPKF